MAGLITTASNPKALWPGIKAWWGTAYDEHEVEYTDLFDMDTSRQNYEDDVQMTTFGLVPRKPEGQTILFDSEVQGFVTRYVHIAYALGFIVTREERDDNLYPIVGKKRAQALAFSFRQTKENIAANVYNRAFNSTYVGGDGVSLLNTAHPNTTGGTFSNKIAVDVDLSEAALEQACIDIMGYSNDRGLLISVMPKVLLVSRFDWFNANRILKSVYQPGNANNDLNILKATNAFPEGIKINHYFTSPHAWFVRTNVQRGMIHYSRVPIQFSEDNDFDTYNMKYKGYERYSFGWTDPRGLYGSNGP